ncbi:MAG TPA: hydroxysqualene dehydroxylase HpnE [Gaiellaceae bacterium]|nr:hydroxysqualene dehydroxylase HpnE [Gaiellaceae bacterium]
MKAVVVGGGLAGLAAALDLADAGCEVTVLEARPTLGGAVQTLPAREGDPDPPPDNGQHIALGCCTEYLGFLARVGQAGSVRREPLALPVIAEDGRVARIAPGALGLLRYGHVSLRDRLAIARVARRLGRLDPAAHDGETFAALLRRLGQSQAAIDRFWDVFIRPGLNVRCEEVSAAPALFTVQTALLGERDGSDVVLPLAPLGAMHGDAAGAALRALGAVVRVGERAAALEENAVLLADGTRVEGDVVVVALPPAESARLLDEPEPGLADSPIVSAHLLFDRPILGFELAALLGSPAHWVFDRGALTGHAPASGQYLTVVSSGAPELLEVRGRALVELLAGELTARLGPAELLWSRVSREPAATFAAVPGTAARRPGPETGRPGVARAGAWTATGWPATMESAVRSGRTAARLLLAGSPSGRGRETLP